MTNKDFKWLKPDLIFQENVQFHRKVGIQSEQFFFIQAVLQ